MSIESIKADYRKALIEMEEIASPLKFDLICEEKANKSLSEKVYRVAVLLLPEKIRR